MARAAVTVRNKPVVPENTCPYIDMAQALIDSMSTQDNAACRRDQAVLATALLEYIRESNERLRESSRFWYNKRTP